MNTRTLIPVALATVVVGGLAWHLLNRPSPTGEENLPHLAPPEDLAVVAGDPGQSLLWEPDTRYVFDLRYETASSTDIGAATGQHGGTVIVGEIELEGHLNIDVVETYDDGAMRARLTISELDEGHFTLGAMADVDREELAEHLAGAELYVALGACGDVREVGANGDTANLGAEILRNVVQDARFAVCDMAGERSWSAVEATPHGLANVRYITAEDGGVNRELAGYRSLRVAAGGAPDARYEGSAQAVVAERSLRWMDATERISWTDGGAPRLDVETSVTLRAVDSTPVQVAYADYIEWTTPDSRPVSRDVQRRLLEQRAQGLSAERVVERVAAHVPGDGPDYRRFMWQAPARTALDGETVVPALLELATAEHTPHATVSLALDILAQAGTERAALGLLTALQDPRVTNDDYYPLYVQRATLVRNPPAALVEFIASASAGADTDDAWAARYALGALVASLDDADRGDEADPHHTTLAAALAESGPGEGRAHWVRAVSNAEREADVPALLSLVDDPEPSVRLAVATGLEMIPGPEQRDALLALAGDTDLMVQRTALLGLRVQPLRPGDIAVLGDHLEAGRMLPRNERVLIEALAQAAEHDPDGALAIADMLAVSSDDAQVIAATQNLREWALSRR